MTENYLEIYHTVAVIFERSRQRSISPLLYGRCKKLDDPGFLGSIGLNVCGFKLLLLKFNSYFKYKFHTEKGGRPARLPVTHTVLAMVLTFYVDPISHKRCCELFGIPRSTQSRIFRRAEIALGRALQDMVDARISWPTLGQQTEFAKLINYKEPLIENKFGFIDGTLCFGADGTIIWMCHNNPGSWNDAETSREFQERLLDKDYCPDQTMGVVSDSAFPVSTNLFTRIETPLKSGDIDRIPVHLRHNAVAKSNAITSIRQAAEWGMGSYLKGYPKGCHTTHI
ncbi:hypothetical protein BC833DRAFT_635976 [Globomyces pollinis-pini]|nr:hypothetical protein BC833DRAFT_635976 [Globomyces pollinis-pini]